MMDLTAYTLKELILPILLIIAAIVQFRHPGNRITGLKNPIQLLVFALVAFFLVFALISPAFPKSLISLSNYLEISLLIYFLRPIFKDSEKINWFLIFILILDGLYCLLAGTQLIQGIRSGLGFQAAMENLSGGFEQSISFSLFLLISIPVLLLIIIYKDTKWKIASGGILSIAFIIILLQAFPIVLGTMLLSGILSLLIILILLMRYRLSRHRLKQLILFGGISLIVSAGIISLGLQTDSTGRYQQKISAISNYQYGANLEKPDIWEQSMNLFRDDVLTGKGFGNWDVFFASEGLKDIRGWDKANPATHPQNEFILLLSETGLAGFLLFSLILVLALIHYIRRIQGDFPTTGKVRSTGFLIILIIIITILLLTDQMKEAELRLLLAFSVAGAIGSVRESAERQPIHFSVAGGRVFSGILVLIATGIMLVRWDESMSRRNLADMEAAVAASDFAKAKEYASEAAGRLPAGNAKGYPIAALQAGLLAREQAYDQAAGLFRQAIRQAPFNTLLLMQAGINELSGSRPAAGLNLLSIAHQINPFDQEIQLFRSLALLQANHPDSAYAAFAALPDSFSHPELNSIRANLLQIRLAIVLNQLSEPFLQETVGRIVQDSAWAHVCWTHCRADKTHFDYQAVLEAIYALEILDKTLPAHEAAILREKYRYLNK